MTGCLRISEIKNSVEWPLRLNLEQRIGHFLVNRVLLTCVDKHIPVVLIP